MEEDQVAARRFFNELVRITGWSFYRLAKQGGFAHTTLTRFMNDDSVTWLPSNRTLGKIKKALATDHVMTAAEFDTLWSWSQRNPQSRQSASPRSRR